MLRRCENALSRFATAGNRISTTNSLDGLLLRCCPQIQKERRAKRILQRQAERQSHSIVLGGRKKVKEFCYDLTVQREKVNISYCRYHAHSRCLLSSMVSSGYVGCICP